MFDRTKWKPGPWDTEPDQLDWTSEYGLNCRMRRNRFGAWCGYVQIRPGHPWFGKDYSDVVEASPELLAREVSLNRIAVLNLFASAMWGDDPAETGTAEICLLVDVHGGLNWGRNMPGGFDGEPDGAWWFGFDCSHCHDFAPASSPFPHQVYRTAGYVQAETNGLARQLWLVGLALA